MKFIDVEVIQEELSQAARTSEKITKMVMDECESVGHGLLSAAFTYAVLAKCAPVHIPVEDLHEILDVAYKVVSEVDGGARVIQ